jgi:nucleoid-associated protein YgaU
MPAGKKLAVVLSVLAAGGGTALFFRKDASQTQENVPGTDDIIQIGEPFERRLSADASAGGIARLGRPFQMPTAAAGATFEQRENPPPVAYHRVIHPNALRGRELDGDEDSPIVIDDDPAEADQRPLRAPANRHMIVDGDTLSKLAQRYLGNSQRYLEIFEQNKGLLSSPDLLPIGKVLEISDRPEVYGKGREQSTAAGQGSAEFPRLVPIPPGTFRRPG